MSRMLLNSPTKDQIARQAATVAALMHFRPLEAGLEAGDLVWLETPRNPTCELKGIEAHAVRAHAAGARRPDWLRGWNRESLASGTLPSHPTPITISP